MMADYLQYFPQPFLDDLRDGRVLPIIGAGLSFNANTRSGQKLPLWDDLGKSVAGCLQDYPYTATIDAISAYAHEFGRTSLVEKLFKLLLVNDSTPGRAHEAFCSLPFELVCTTNFDFLLESQYSKLSRYCRPIIDEEQLSVSSLSSGVTLIKLHGDLHHPQRLVVTEEDYSRFLETYPLLSTYLANLLITRTPFLVGYSMDDPDFRQVWQVVSDRLGRLRRPAYALTVSASSSSIARFARRGVRLISLPGSKEEFGTVLAEAFIQLNTYWTDNVVATSQVTEEDSLRELSLPPNAKSRLCFFAVPNRLISFYKEYIFPLTVRHGFVPISAHDMISPGDNWLAKVDVLIDRAAIVVVDYSSTFTGFELERAIRKKQVDKILLIKQSDSTVPAEARQLLTIERQVSVELQGQAFLGEVEQWLQAKSSVLKQDLNHEPRNLLELGQNRAAVISAMTLFEAALREQLTDEDLFPGLPSLRNLIKAAAAKRLVAEDQLDMLSEWIKIRNELVHTMVDVEPKLAKKIVDGIESMVTDIGSPIKKSTSSRRSSHKS